MADDYTPGAGGRLPPCESALSSLPLCEVVTDGRTCLEHVTLVPGTLYRVRCASGHERIADHGEPEAIDGALAAYHRRAVWGI